ncbi:unnamed protein product [Acidocella sp. C78]|nr:unnamed protein product [Acidocella sp. C78]
MARIRASARDIKATGPSAISRARPRIMNRNDQDFAPEGAIWR